MLANVMGGLLGSTFIDYNIFHKKYAIKEYGYFDNFKDFERINGKIQLTIILYIVIVISMTRGIMSEISRTQESFYNQKVLTTLLSLMQINITQIRHHILSVLTINQKQYHKIYQKCSS